MIKKILTMISALSLSTTAHAQAMKVDLAKDLKVAPVDLYGTVKEKAKLTPLAQLKDFEIRLKWAECATQAAKIFPSQKDLRGWVAVSWLHCLEQNLKKNTPASVVSTVGPALTTIGSQSGIFEKHQPWAVDLSSSWVSLRLLVLEEMVQKKMAQADHAVDGLLSSVHTLSKEQKSQAYRMLGDIAQSKVNYAEAQFFYEQAQDQKDSRYLQERIDFLIKARGQTPLEKPAAETPMEMGEEIKIEERLRAAARKNELTTAIQDAVTILNQFPGSRAARRVKDRPLELYNQISDSGGKTKALQAMREADPARLLEWAQNLHRRADYAGAFSLAEQAFEKNQQSASTTSLLWILGRSAHFTGHYDRALDYYSKLIVGHAGSDEAAEAQFRSALIYYRKKDFRNSASLLERLLTQNKDRYDLNGRYWLVRALQETNSERARKEAAELMNRYPFSYYGLRLRAESSNQKLSWPEFSEKAPELKTEFYIVGNQTSAWRRFKSLSAAGWLSEAQMELSALPFMKDPTLKISLAEKLAQQNQVMPAIRLINEAMEEDPRLRREQFIKIGYPKSFATWFEAEGDRYGLSPVLLRSLTRQESGFNLRAVSTSNALGLMQMIPPTADEVSKKLGLKIELPDDMFRPEVNIPMGSYYVNQMLGQFQNNVPFALAAYNAGPARVKIWSEARPEIVSVITTPSSAPKDEIWFDELPWNETSFYVKAILRNILLYRLAEDGSFTLKPVLWQDLVNKKAK